MGKKGFNAKARQVVKTSVDNSKINEIKLDFGLSEYGSSDASNLLALPSKKRETKIVKDKKEKIRILSKAQRKRLEKIVDKKHKKANRAALLESLSKCQASQDEVKHMTAISTVQTLGLKKLSDLNVEKVVQESDVPDKNKKYSSIAGAKKRLRLLKLESTNAPKKRKYDPNVVGLEESSSEESESSADEDDEPEIINDVTSKIDEQKNEKDETEINTEKYVTSEVIKENNNVELIKDSQSEEPRKEQKVEKKPLLTHEAKPVQVTRDPKIQVARLKLPILGEEQRIMEAINENEIVIIAGETGSGKTTQIPQFLYEAGYTEHKMIGITEPRRVAAVAMSQRVAQELGLAGAEVGYLMRFEGNVTKDTKIKFMTDGVLLKEIQSDFLLSKYSVIIIDEAHERSVYTDILLGLLSRIVPVRRKRGSPLRLIIMSATLRVEDFTENTTLFKQPPPVIKVESRQFPVTVHFNRRTNSDYLKEAFRKTVKIHTRLPDGGILIFVTGQQEVHYLVRKLKAAFPYKQDVDYSKMAANKTTPGDTALDSEPDDIQSDDDEVEKEMKRARKARRKARVKSKLPKLPKVNLDDFDLPDDDGHADLLERDADSDGHLSDSEEEEEDAPLSASIRACRQPLWVLPLYSMLDSRQQARVFRPPPPGARLCVVSTDVAETSLTIPAVHYVVDTGKKKMRVYDGLTGASAYRVVWTAKAAAEQRAGRAGRTAPGHVYRLYSSAVYQHECPAVYPPDLCRRPVDDLLLTLKCMGVDKVVNFPFPTAPDRLQLRLAERRLETLGILERPPFAPTRRRGEEELPPVRKDLREEELARNFTVLKVTPLGKAVSAFPLLPRYGKMLALSHQHDLLPYTIALVAALSVPELLSGSSELWPATGQLQLLGDAGVLLRAVGAAELARYNADDAFCAKHGLREKAVTEIRKIRRQLTSEINLCVAGVSLCVDPRLPPPTDAQARLLRQLLLSGLADQVARKISLADVPEGEDRRKYKYAYQCSQISEPIFLHSGSLLRRVIPEWVVYQELYESGGEEKKKLVMRTVAAVEPEWLPVYVPQLCNLGEPLEEPPPRYDAASGRVRCHFSGTFGKQGWPLPCVEIDYPDTVDRYRWFARFLLEGAVVARLRRYSGSLLSPASTMVKSWSRLQPRAQGVLQALTTHAVGNKQLLLDRWTTDPQFLLEEYLSWLPQSAHNEVSLFWPPRD